LAVAQGKVKKEIYDSKEKLMTLITSVVEEILEQEGDVKKEVMIKNKTSKMFMEAWRGATQKA
jgi:hypothetical protein